MSYRPTVSHEIISAIDHNQIITMYLQHRKGADPADIAPCFPPGVPVARPNSGAASRHFGSLIRANVYVSVSDTRAHKHLCA